MKRVFLTASVATMMLAACGGEEEVKNTNENEVEEIDVAEELKNTEGLTQEEKELLAKSGIVIDGVPMEEIIEGEQPKELTVETAITQLGNDSFSNKTEALAPDMYVSEEVDGYTYVLAVDSVSTIGDGTHYFLFISIIKDGEYVVKEKAIRMDEFLEKQILSSEEKLYDIENIGFDQNHILVAAVVKNANGEEIGHLINIAVNKEGEIDQHILSEGSFSPSVVKDLSGTSYFQTNVDSKYKILDKDGKGLFEFTYDDSFPEDIRTQYLDIEGERFYFSEYFRSVRKESDEVYAYDLKAKEIIWDEAGAMKQYDFTKDYGYTHIKGENGVYAVELYDYWDKDKIVVQYHGYDSTKDTFELVAETEYPIGTGFYTREGRSESVGGHLAVDEDNLIIYANVVYKGKPTIQKFVVPRIDK